MTLPTASHPHYPFAVSHFSKNTLVLIASACHHGIGPERRAALKSRAYIQSYRRLLPLPGLQPQHRQSRRACLLLDTRQQRLRHALAPRAIAHVHPLDLGEIREQRDPAASHRLTAQPRHEEPDMRLKDRIQVQAMPLLRRILRRKHPIELPDQRAHLIGRDQHRLDLNIAFTAHRALHRPAQLPAHTAGRMIPS